MTKADTVVKDEIVFSHMGQNFVAEGTDVIVENGFVLYEIYSPEDVFTGNIYLHPDENKTAALVEWSAYN